jgi:23S rRNA pseudouridine1911/1915/1917 synthase
MGDSTGIVEPERLTFVVPPNQAKERIDFYLAHQIQNASRSKVQSAIDAGAVLLNGKAVKASQQILPGDSIIVTLPRPPRPQAIPEDIPLDIVYEDEYLLVVNKKAGMVTHPAYGNYSGTLVNALLYHCTRLSKGDTRLRPGIVHRLDKDTSGLLVVAKDDGIHRQLAKQFSAHSIKREYWALVWGVFKTRKGTIEASLGRSKSDRKKVAVREDGKPAITEYEVIKEYEFLTLLKLHLRTGRTHQIRVHLAHIGHPIFGDPTYGGRTATWSGLSGKKEQHASNLLKLIHRQALHAKVIGFIHPGTREEVYFESELPEDLKETLENV